MNNLSRRQFIKLCSLLGLSLPLQAMVSGCASPEETTSEAVAPDASGSVLIIGAGAAGMAAGYLLTQAGVDVQILEAAPTYGGRMKRTTTFADFPIPLGAEWLHVDRTELDVIVNDDTVEITTQTRAYSPADSRYGYVEDGEMITYPLAGVSDRKFINSTWFDFFDQFIVPSIGAKMQFETQIVKVDTQGDGVVLTDQNGNSYQAQRVIVTVPLKILQDGDLEFIPPLPADKIEAIEDAPVWGGIKVFLEFREKFYPTFLEAPNSDTDEGQRAYYDAAYGQDTSANILGLFAVGEQAEAYQTRSDEAVRDYILAELDGIFDGVPSQSYIKHVVQNWNEEPFVRAAYLADNAPDYIAEELSWSIDGKLFFAGEAYGQHGSWGAVDDAAWSARDVVAEILSDG